MVLEILEDIEPTDEIIFACKKLKEKGYTLALDDLKGNNTNELIKVSLQRAKLCEFICIMSIYKEKRFSAYMTGLFSAVDAILNCHIKVIVNDLGIVYEVKDGLLEEKNPLNTMLKLVINYEKG